MTWNLRRRVAGSQGFGAIKMMMTLALVGILGGMAGLQVSQAQPAAKGDGAMRVILGQLNIARELAVSQRRQMQVVFAGTNQMQTVRMELNGTTTLLSTVSLEGGVQFSLMAGVPDTPDGFGDAAAVSFGVATKLLFNTDGTFIDQGGNPLNGSVFVAQPLVARSFRAVTILGSTARVRGYRWNGATWVLL